MEGVKTILSLLGDLATFFWLTLRPQSELAAENLFLRKQLAVFQERKKKPRRPDAPIRITLVLLSRLFSWRDTLVVVQPQTLIRWHRQGFRLFWRYPPYDLPITPQIHRHRIPKHFKVVARPILGGLHHEYVLMPTAA